MDRKAAAIYKINKGTVVVHSGLFKTLTVYIFLWIWRNNRLNFESWSVFLRHVFNNLYWLTGFLSVCLGLLLLCQVTFPEVCHVSCCGEFCHCWGKKKNVSCYWQVTGQALWEKWEISFNKKRTCRLAATRKCLPDSANMNIQLSFLFETTGISTDIMWWMFCHTLVSEERTDTGAKWPCLPSH